MKTTIPSTYVSCLPHQPLPPDWTRDEPWPGAPAEMLEPQREWEIMLTVNGTGVLSPGFIPQGVAVINGGALHSVAGTNVLGGNITLASAAVGVTVDSGMLTLSGVIATANRHTHGRGMPNPIVANNSCACCK